MHKDILIILIFFFSFYFVQCVVVFFLCLMYFLKTLKDMRQDFQKIPDISISHKILTCLKLPKGYRLHKSWNLCCGGSLFCLLVSRVLFWEEINQHLKIFQKKRWESNQAFYSFSQIATLLTVLSGKRMSSISYWEEVCISHVLDLSTLRETSNLGRMREVYISAKFRHWQHQCLAPRLSKGVFPLSGRNRVSCPRFICSI